MHDNVILIEDEERHEQLLPLTYTRAVSSLRIGILTLAEKWASRLSFLPGLRCAHPYLQPLYGACRLEEGQSAYFVDAALCLSDAFYRVMQSLAPREGLFYEDRLVCVRLTDCKATRAVLAEGAPLASLAAEVAGVRRPPNARLIHTLPQCLGLHESEMLQDFSHLVPSASSLKNSSFFQSGKEPLFIDPSAQVGHAFFDTSEGPIYIGPRARIEDAVTLQGPCAVAEGAVATAGAKIRKATCIGPYCKVGGEVVQSILHSYSNKAHEGFLGSSMVGSWCNLGAATTCSNLKNTYGEVSLWSFSKNAYENTGKQFCGLFMADYAKTGIHQLFNTGSVIGPFSNIFGGDMAPRYVPPFSWGAGKDAQSYRIQEALKHADRMMNRRDKALSEAEKEAYAHLFERTAPLRSWEKTP